MKSCTFPKRKHIEPAQLNNTVSPEKKILLVKATNQENIINGI